MLWLVYQVTKINPIWFLLASVKAMGWNVEVIGNDNDDVSQFIIKNPSYKDDK
jgi:hypothetical protein